MTTNSNIQDYISAKRNLIAEMRMDGQTIFGKLEELLIAELKDACSYCGYPGQLGAALATALDDTVEDLPPAIAGGVRSAYRSATQLLALDDPQLDYLDANDHETGHPCGFVHLSFRPRTFEAEVSRQLDLCIDEPTRVIWELRGSVAFQPRLDIPCMLDLELVDLQIYHSVLRSTWGDAVAWTKLLGGGSLFSF